jgi:hypothetical protein
LDIFKRTNKYEVLSTAEPRNNAEKSYGSGMGPTKSFNKEEIKVPSFVPTVKYTKEEEDRML